MNREDLRRHLIDHLRGLRDLGFLCLEPVEPQTAPAERTRQTDDPQANLGEAPSVAVTKPPVADSSWPMSLFSRSVGSPLDVVHPPFSIDTIGMSEEIAPASRETRSVEPLDLFSPDAPTEPPKEPPPGEPTAGESAPAEETAEVPLSFEARVEALSAIANETAQCTACGLHAGRSHVVPGQGNPLAPIAFVGEGPGFHEDRQGLAFVGRAGQLLTDIIGAMGLTRDDVFICNVVKCRPPENRNPNPEEMSACEPFLKRQLEIIRPAVIVALGTVALRCLLQIPNVSITRIRGQWRTYQGIPLMPTFHPAYLLRNPGGKRQVWEDMQKVMQVFGLKPGKSRQGEEGT